MAFVQILYMSILVAVAVSQRPSFAGTRPIGYPELYNRSTTPGSLGDRFGEVDGTTQRLPIEAQGDRDLLDRLSKLPQDKQPFWYLNWQALEANRQKPQTYPQKPNPFIDNGQITVPEPSVNVMPLLINRNEAMAPFVNKNEPKPLILDVRNGDAESSGNKKVELSGNRNGAAGLSSVVNGGLSDNKNGVTATSMNKNRVTAPLSNKTDSHLMPTSSPGHTGSGSVDNDYDYDVPHTEKNNEHSHENSHESSHESLENYPYYL